MSHIDVYSVRIAKILTLVAALATSMAVNAQSGSSNLGFLEEVVVTAQRKVESLQDVPISISALSADAIEKSDTHDLSSVAIQVPGLTFSSFSPGQNLLSLRGASSNDDGAGTDSSVAVFVDDVYLGRISNINPELFDLERIEVLRGPQGTLYGKNTIGGALNITSTKPNLDRFEAKIKAGVGNYSRVNAAGLVSGPLGKNLAYKVTGSYRERDGWANNLRLNKKQKDDKAAGVKAQLLFATDSLDILLSADYNNLDVEDMARVPVRRFYDGIGENAERHLGRFRGAYETVCGDITGSKCAAGPIDGYAKRETFGASGKLIWDINDSMELTIITAYRESESDWNMDSIGSPALYVNDDIFDTTEQVSQEIRFAHVPNDRINYVVGLWFLNEETDRTECFDLNAFGPAGRGTKSKIKDTDCTQLDDGSEGYNQVNETDSFAVFAQADFLLKEHLTLTLGGRFSHEEKKIVSRAVTNERASALGECVSRDNPAKGIKATASGLCIIAQDLDPLAITRSWNAFTPKFSVNYAVNSDMNVYFTFARGFKSGGFPAAPQTQADAERVLDQEEATNFEVGVKSLLNGLVRLNFSLFRTEYEGLQIQNFGSPSDQPEAFGRFQTFNAGGGTVTGIELESTMLFTPNFTGTMFLSTADSKFGETNIDNGAANANQQGNDFLRTPKLKYGINLDYDLFFAGGQSVNINTSYNYTSGQRGDLPSYALQPAFSLLDARVAWTSASENLEVAFWVKNMLDKEYISHIYTIAGGNVTAVYGDPVMYGLNVTYSF